MKLHTNLAILSLAALAATQSSAQTNLPDLGAGGEATELSNTGLIVGSVFEPSDHSLQAALWRNRVLSILPKSDHQNARAYGVSDSGYVVGAVGVLWQDVLENPARWSPAGVLTELQNLGFGGRATAVSSDGTAVGYVYDGPNTLRWACKWLANGDLVLLRDPSGSSVASIANDINASGHIVGAVKVLADRETAAKWSSSLVTLLDNEEWADVYSADAITNSNSILLKKFNYYEYRFWSVVRQPDGSDLEVAEFTPGRHQFVEDLNGAQNLAGFAFTQVGDDANVSRAVAWLTPSTPIALPMPDPALSSVGNGINEAGFVVGAIRDYTAGTSVPVIWEPLPGFGQTLSPRPVRGAPGQLVTMSASLQAAGKPVAGELVRFLREDLSLIGSARTNAQGLASINVQIPPSAKPFSTMDFMASLGGGRYSRGTMEVLAHPTGFTMSPMVGTRGQNLGVVAKLIHRISGQAMANQPVAITLMGQTFNVRTTSTGNAVINWRVPTTLQAGAQLAVRFRFAGTATHAAVSADGTITIR